MLGGRTKRHPYNDGSRFVKRVSITNDMLFNTLLLYPFHREGFNVIRNKNTITWKRVIADS